MFDLFRSREKTVRYLLGAVLLIVALSLVITLVPGYGSGTTAQRDQVLADIGDEQLTATEVRSAMQREMRNKSIPAQMAEFYVPVFVNQMVADRAAVYAAKKMGFDVTEEELGNALRSLVPMLFQDGKFAGNDAYAGFLAQQNMSISEFEDGVKKQIILNRFESLALEGVIVTPADVEQEFRQKNEKLKISYFQVAPDKFKSSVEVTPAELAESYAKNKPMYRIPEKKNLTLFVVDESKVAGSITVPEEELRRAYDARKDSFRTPERVHVRHILLKTTDKSPEEVTKIQKRMEDLLKQVKSGGDFAELAKKNSEDTGSAVKGGDLDWVVRGQTVPEFEKTAFALKPGEVSGIVKTMYGFHILKLEAKEDARLKSFDEVKAELSRELGAQQAATKTQTIADQVHSALVRSSAEAEKVAQANGVAVIHVQGAGQGDPVQEVGVNADFQEAIGKLKKGGVTGVVPIAGAKLVMAQVTDIVAARQAEFNEVEAKVRAGVIGEKSEMMLKQKIDEATQKLLAPNVDFAKLAKEFGAEVKNPPEFAREAAVEGMGPASLITEGFQKNVGDTFGPAHTSGGAYFFCKVVGKVPADLTQLPAQRASILDSIKQRRAKERRDLFADGIVKELIKEKKLKLHDDAIKRLAVSYRGA
jgi:peptidyl-prolyl cis-trans isomerase D